MRGNVFLPIADGVDAFRSGLGQGRRGAGRGRTEAEREILLLEERAGLLGGDGSRVGLGPHGVDLLVQLTDERVRLLGHRNGVIRVQRELLFRQEERHFGNSIPQYQRSA